MDTKKCVTCGAEKPFAEFYKNNQRTDGLTGDCKPCRRAKMAVYQMRPARHQTPDGTKRCTLCKETKPNEAFHRNQNFGDGLDRACKACRYVRHSAYSKANRATLNAKMGERYRNDPERYADYSLKKTLGLPLGSYAKMHAAQGGRCAICDTTEPGSRTKRFHVDHCHTTGKIRALLCEGCNHGLGKFHDRPDLLRGAADYLERHRE